MHTKNFDRLALALNKYRVSYFYVPVITNKHLEM